MPKPKACGVVSSMRVRVTDRTVASTPEKVRAPALLYYGQGLEQGKVATTLGVSRRTVLYRLAEFTRQMMHLDALAKAGEA